MAFIKSRFFGRRLSSQGSARRNLALYIYIYIYIYTYTYMYIHIHTNIPLATHTNSQLQGSPQVPSLPEIAVVCLSLGPRSLATSATQPVAAWPTPSRVSWPAHARWSVWTTDVACDRLVAGHAASFAYCFVCVCACVWSRCVCVCVCVSEYIYSYAPSNQYIYKRLYIYIYISTYTQHTHIRT